MVWLIAQVPESVPPEPIYTYSSFYDGYDYPYDPKQFDTWIGYPTCPTSRPGVEVPC